VRIAHVITRFIRGGADENTLLSCNAQAAAGHEVLLIHGDEAAQGIIDRLDPGVQRTVSPSLVRSLRPAAEVRAVAEIAGRLKAFKPHIVHTHTSKAGVLGRLAARMVGTPGVVHGVHIAPFLNVGAGERAVYLLAERMLAPMTDMFVNVSEGMRRACLDHGVGDVAKHVVVPSGMDVDAFRSARPLSRPELAERLGAALPPDLKLLLIVAGFEPRKRQAEFLEVFARLAARSRWWSTGRPVSLSPSTRSRPPRSRSTPCFPTRP
jgi:glycosyltransferase involved in cell wall biosynthesis